MNSTPAPPMRRETAATIRETLAATGELLDPHTAVGYAVARKPRGHVEPDGDAGHRPSGQIPRCGRKGQRHPARACHPALPT